MRVSVFLALALLVSAAQAQGLQIHAAVALDVEGDTEGMTRRPVVTSPDRYVWVGDVVLDLPPSSIQTVGLETDDDGGTALSLWLSEEAGRAFAALTEQSIGKALAVVYHERVLTAPVVMSAIPNGLVMITGLDEDEAQEIADALRQATTPDASPDGSSYPPPRIVAPAPPRSPSPDQGAAPSPPVSLDPSSDDTIPSPEAGRVAQAFVDGIAERDWQAVSELLHPEAVRVARASALSILQLAGGTVTVRSDGMEGSFIAADVLDDAPSDALADLGDRDVTTLYLAALDILGVWGSPGPPRQIIGEIRDGERIHVLLRATTAESGVSDVSLVTLARDGADWRPLLTQPQGF